MGAALTSAVPAVPLAAAAGEAALELAPLLLVLLVAWTAGRLATRIGYPSVLGEILAGIVLGPPLLGLLTDAPGLAALGELGVVLMMLYIGTEIDTADLRRASTAGLLAAVGGFVVPALSGFAVTLAFGGTAIAGAFVAIAVGVTSLATKSRILVDLDLLDTRIAYVMMAGALVADTATLVLFAAIIGFVEVGGFDLAGTTQVALEAGGFFAVAAAIGVWVLPAATRWVDRRAVDDRLLRFVFVLGVGLGYAELAEFAGLHAVLGAFVAGILLRRTVLGGHSFREVNRTVHDLSIGLLAPVFFVTAGFQTSMSVFRTDLGLLLAIVAVAVLGKIVGTALFYLPSGHGWREGITVGAGMNGRGAVEIIVAGIGLERGLITAELFTILVFMAIATTAMVPLMLKWCVEWLRRHGQLAPAGQRRVGTVIVGCGPLGRALASRLASAGHPVRLVDSNPHRTAEARRNGLAAVTGDAIEPETLERAGAGSARYLIALTPNAEVNVLAAHVARESFVVPQTFVALRSTTEAGRQAMLDSSDARPLFDAAIDTSLWDRWIAGGEVVSEVLEVDEGQFEEVRRLLRGGRNAYPLTVERADEEVPFAAVEVLHPGDRLHVLRHRATNQMQNAAVVDAAPGGPPSG